MTSRLLPSLLCFLATGILCATAGDRPNIVVIMADDMGYSDIGCYGGEIATPQLDALAADGVRFTQFYNTGRCCPTRASLLTGLYPHAAGVGHMTNDRGPHKPGYRGRLTKRCVTIAEALKEAGYVTAMTGKWHVGSDRPHWPTRRGFEHFYGVPQGGGFFFTPRRDREVVLGEKTLYTSENPPPDGWYLTDAFNEYAIRFIDAAAKSDKPLFLYLAHHAPHFPLQVPVGEETPYLEKYENGWDPIRHARWKRQKEIGLTTDAWELTARDNPDRIWEALSASERAEQTKAMAIYAAMVTHMDATIGQLVDALRQHDMLDNTLLLFLSDNGGNAEGGTFARDSKKAPLDQWGSDASYLRCGKLWANAQNTPFRRYKHHTHEGGIATPLIAHWPDGIKRERGSYCRAPAHVIDLMATCLDLADATYPERFEGQQILPSEGKSLRPLLQGTAETIHEALFWEHEGNRAIRIGDWKLVAGHKQPWELYDLADDRSERNDLAQSHTDRVEAMSRRWDAWAKRNFVIDWENVKK